jgi:hypothetical protein
MGALVLLWPVGRLLLISQEAVHVPREPVLQAPKVLLAVAQEVVRSTPVRVRRLKRPVLADIPSGVLFVEDKVPGTG